MLSGKTFVSHFYKIEVHIIIWVCLRVKGNGFGDDCSFKRGKPKKSSLFGRPTELRELRKQPHVSSKLLLREPGV